MPRPAALSDFAGRWRLTRRIEDRVTGRPGRFAGEARLTPDGAGLRYEERGLLWLGDGGPLAAARVHLWRPDGDGVAVLFADGRPFHGFRPRGLAPGTEHRCGADLYRVVYDLRAWPAWEARWTVAGPRKDHDILSAYAPL
jgi:hypothetical protein